MSTPYLEAEVPLENDGVLFARVLPKYLIYDN